MPCYERRVISLTMDNFDVDVFRTGAEMMGYELKTYGNTITIRKNNAQIGTVDSRTGAFIFGSAQNEELNNKMRQVYSVGIVSSSAQGGLVIQEQTEDGGVVRMQINSGGGL